MTALARSSARPSVRRAARRAMDPLGVVIALALAGAAALPLVTLRANRIVAGEPRGLIEALSPVVAATLAVALAAAAVVALVRSPARLRLLAGAAGIAVLALAVGAAARHLTPAGDTLARVSLASGFWVALAALGLLAADALTRLGLAPRGRILALAVAAAGLALLLASGAWDGLSLLREYSVRADAFWREAGRHLWLAFGSLAAALLIGLPLGLLCHRLARPRAAVLGALTMVQTVPSLALFGLLIAPLGWLAATVPGAAALGVRGIGVAPAFVALVLYALLPVVAGTVAGLAGVPAAALDAARGMGMTVGQRLFGVAVPLAAPVLLTAVRIVLVQNIGLATIAALVGGGGFGVFVFQGLGQTATDLVLLGAVPTVILAFAAAVVLDALAEASRGGRR